MIKTINFSITKQGAEYAGKFRLGGVAREFRGKDAMDVADMCAEFAGEIGHMPVFRKTKAYREMEAQMRAALGRSSLQNGV